MGAHPKNGRSCSRPVCIMTYKKAVEFKNQHDISWTETGTRLNLAPAEMQFIRDHYNGFLDAKRIEEDKLLNQNYTQNA